MQLPEVQSQYHCPRCFPHPRRLLHPRPSRWIRYEPRLAKPQIETSEEAPALQTRVQLKTTSEFINNVGGFTNKERLERKIITVSGTIQVQVFVLDDKDGAP